MIKKSALLSLALSAWSVFAQDKDGSLPTGMKPTVTAPTLNAKLTVGFNYDLLRAPTDVSFDFASGNLAFNFPLEQSGLIPREKSDNVWAEMGQKISADSSSGARFQPQTSAKQYANTTIRVDVPMLGGVATFSNIQNVYFNYTNILGNSTVRLQYDTTMKSQSGTQSVFMNLIGTINLPLEANLAWETMTFGYAYRVNKNLAAAMNLHRHIFHIDMLAKMDIDLLGKVKVDQTADNADGAGGGMGSLSGSSLSLEKEINYPHQRMFGQASGHYEAEAWSYSLGLKLWRFTLTSRFGIDTKAKGSFVADYRVPAGIVDKKTFQISEEIQDPQKLITGSTLNNLQQGNTDSVVYRTNEDATWKLPSGHTISLDIIRDHFSLSYTKVLGSIEMFHSHEESLSTGGTKRLVDLDVGVTVDNVILLNAKLYTAFVNIGLFTMDIRVFNDKHVLGDAFTKAKLNNLKWGDAAMLPVLNFGAAIGIKSQLAFEIDLLPLPAFKTGVVYHF